MQGDQVIAKILKAEGVEWLAAFPAQTLIDQAAREGIRPILCRQERAGVNMADGFSRVKNGKVVGVFTMQTGRARKTPLLVSRRPSPTRFPCCCSPAGNPAAVRKCIPTLSQCPITAG